MKKYTRNQAYKDEGNTIFALQEFQVYQGAQKKHAYKVFSTCWLEEINKVNALSCLFPVIFFT